jgi:hypothetical protein
MTSPASSRADPASGGALIDLAAESLGGKARVLAVQTFRQYSYGQNNAQDGGGNVSASPHAPQKRVAIDAQVRTIDYPNRRMHLTQRQVQAFEFAYAHFMDTGNKIEQGLDGDVAYNLVGNRANAGAPQPQRLAPLLARTRRIEMLDNPLSIVRAALEPGAKLTVPRSESDGDQVMDLTTAQGDTVTIALASRTHRPQWMRWVGPHPVYGDLTYTTYFTGYEPLGESGLTLPFGYQTVCDYHGVVLSEVYVDKYVINGLEPAERADLAAPTAAASAPIPAGPAAPTIEATQAAPHVWYLHSSVNGSSTAFEFRDHITVFEAYVSEANFEAILAKIHEVLPGKPVTQLIISHHHLDHTGGLRAAVAEGLEVITNRGENEVFVHEVTGRPARQFPDLLQTRGRVGHVRILPVDERMVLKDSTLEVDVLRIVADNHMSDALLAYVPGAHIVAEGDLMDDTWDASWWGNTYPATVKYWHLEVEHDLPVHGQMHTYAEVLALTQHQIEGAQALCTRAEGAGFSLPGCPVANTLDGYR